MQSMTGFGRAQQSTPHYQIEVELSSVNRKQIDISLNLPKNLLELEPSIRKQLSTKLSRGRLNASIRLSQSQTSNNCPSINKEKVSALYSQLLELSEQCPGIPAPKWQDLLQFPEMIDTEACSIKADTALQELSPVIQEALDNLIEMRKAEGKNLQLDLAQRLQQLRNLLQKIHQLAPSTVEFYRNTLHERLKALELNIDLNDERFVKEIAIFAERCDISEEITRLQSHFDLFENSFQKKEPIGRSLDFLCQEINREFTTINSKANNAQLAQLVVQAKTDLEKIREQVQNVE